MELGEFAPAGTKAHEGDQQSFAEVREQVAQLSAFFKGFARQGKFEPME